MFAQDVTTVRANSSDISDNLDLRAVASVFGESRDLEDFERKLNDPDLMISNLDLNGDNRVDYLRVIEATEGNTHLVVVQAVIGRDLFQDVATIEVERDRHNNVQVQVVGDVYMYGPNYIYEPVYVHRPFLYDVFWVSSYRPYYSPWYWGYYPTYYSYWAPYPVYRYRDHVHVHVINTGNRYNYVNTRRSSRAVALHNSRRANAYERQHPDNSFTRRNGTINNRYALEQSRVNNTRTTNASARSTLSSQQVRTSNTARNSNITRSNSVSRTSSNEAVRSTVPSRSNSNVVRTSPTYERTQQAQPSRQSVNRSAVQQRSTPAVRSTPSRTSSPAVRSTPARSSAPVMRSAPTPQRQSAPSGSSRGSSGNSRG